MYMNKYIPTGIKQLDEYTKGFKKGELIVIGGRPAMGKTTFLLNIARNIISDNKRVLYISLEKEGKYLIDLLESLTPNDDRKELAVRQNNIEILDHSSYVMSIELLNRIIYRSIKRFEKKYMCVTLEAVDLIIIDGIDNMFTLNKKPLENTFVHEALISLKHNSLHYDCPIVITATVKREIESRNDRRPTLDDFKSIDGKDNCIDEVIMLYRDSYYDTFNTKTCNPQIELIIEKHSKIGVKTILSKIDGLY